MDGIEKRLLQGVLSKVCKIDENSNELESVLKNVITVLKATVRDPGYTVIAPGDSGTIAAGFRSFSIANTGAEEALVDGSILSAGVSLSFDAGALSDTLGSMSYDAQLSTLAITTVL
jgi:hypothetical protein